MGLRGWNLTVLAAVGALWLLTGIERQRPVLDAAKADGIRPLEADLAAHPEATAPALRLAQAYLDAHAPGLALSVLDAAPAAVRRDPTVLHLNARALVDQGRASDALAIERRVLDRCSAPLAVGGAPACDAWLFASATRRAEILEHLVGLGVNDAQAHPEASQVAYFSATREAHLMMVQ